MASDMVPSAANGYGFRGPVARETPFSAEDHIAATLAHHDSEHVVVEVGNLRAMLAELAQCRVDLAEAREALRDIADRVRMVAGHDPGWWGGS